MKHFLLILVLVCAGVTVQAQPPYARHDHRDGRHQPQPTEHRSPCATPEQMQLVVQTLKNQSFDDKRLEVAKLCVAIGHFCVSDLARMAEEFGYDENRLEFFKFAHPYCVDPENYPRLRGSLYFSSNYDKLMDYLYPGWRH